MTDPKSKTAPLHLGIVLFDKATLLDFAAPWDVFTRLPNATTHLVAHTLEPLTASGMPVAPTTTWDVLEAEDVRLDVICVPGGFGHIKAMEDAVLLDHLRAHAQHAAYVTAVCTGTLVLAAAGLLDGYRATTHWASLDRLARFGVTADPARVVIDKGSDNTKGTRATGGGVTAGLDFALTLAAELRGELVAKSIQLGMEYAPAPPFDAGHPSTADADTLAEVQRQYGGGYVPLMKEVDARALARLKQ